MEEALNYLKTYEWGQDSKPLDAIDEAVIASHGNEASRNEIESKLIEILKSDATRNGKDYVCRKLKIIGTDASVSTLAGMLGDKNHSHMARFALQSIPTEAAGKALIGSLDSLNGELKAGVIGSLGARGDATAVDALGEMVEEGDTVVARSAACALGAIGNAEAAKALAAAKPNDAIMGDVMDATLACAEGMLAAGDKLGALSIYKKLNSGNPAKHIKLAVTRGMLSCAGK